MALAAEIKSGLTSFNADSMILATKGAAATDRGTMAAVDPMLVPIIKRDSGNINIISIINGKERSAFMIFPRKLFRTDLGIKFPFDVTHKITPNGNPRINENIVEKNTMKIVSNVGSTSICIVSNI
jgi:hypothetical protein